MCCLLYDKEQKKKGDGISPVITRFGIYKNYKVHLSANWHIVADQ
jgi:hypothetical protein